MVLPHPPTVPGPALPLRVRCLEQRDLAAHRQQLRVLRRRRRGAVVRRCGPLGEHADARDPGRAGGRTPRQWGGCAPLPSWGPRGGPRARGCRRARALRAPGRGNPTPSCHSQSGRVLSSHGRQGHSGWPGVDGVTGLGQSRWHRGGQRFLAHVVEGRPTVSGQLGVQVLENSPSGLHTEELIRGRRQFCMATLWSFPWCRTQTLRFGAWATTTVGPRTDHGR